MTNPLPTAPPEMLGVPSWVTDTTPQPTPDSTEPPPDVEAVTVVPQD